MKSRGRPDGYSGNDGLATGAVGPFFCFTSLADSLHLGKAGRRGGRGGGGNEEEVEDGRAAREDGACVLPSSPSCACFSSMMRARVAALGVLLGQSPPWPNERPAPLRQFAARSGTAQTRLDLCFFAIALRAPVSPHSVALLPGGASEQVLHGLLAVSNCALRVVGDRENAAALLAYASVVVDDLPPRDASSVRAGTTPKPRSCQPPAPPSSFSPSVPAAPR